jgi:hypothetical protein
MPPHEGKKNLSRTRLDSDRVRMPPVNKKSSPLNQVPDGYRVLVPELPSLYQSVKVCSLLGDYKKLLSATVERTRIPDAPTRENSYTHFVAKGIQIYA